MENNTDGIDEIDEDDVDEILEEMIESDPSFADEDEKPAPLEEERIPDMDDYPD